MPSVKWEICCKCKRLPCPTPYKVCYSIEISRLEKEADVSSPMARLDSWLACHNHFLSD